LVPCSSRAACNQQIGKGGGGAAAFWQQLLTGRPAVSVGARDSGALLLRSHRKGEIGQKTNRSWAVLLRGVLWSTERPIACQHSLGALLLESYLQTVQNDTVQE
jgi:hypothetical protein